MSNKLVTRLKVSPSDWFTNPLSVKSSWRIWYRYNGKLVKIMGMNREKSYQDRVFVTRQLLAAEEEKLSRYGYNPLDKTFQIAPPTASKEPDSQKMFLDALNLAISQLSCDHKTVLNVKSCIKYISESARSLCYDNLPISQIRKKHLKLLMNHCKEKRDISDRTWNAYRAYLMMLFEQLDDLEMIDHNPAKELRKAKETLTLRQTLTSSEREKVKEHLRLHYPDFYRFVQIFFHSGSRRTELLSLKVKNVDLTKGEFITLVKKGSQKRFVKRVIKNIAHSYWEQQLQICKQEDFVFSIGLLPGPLKIREEQITRRWRRLVKDKLGIKADFYSLKHLNTDETASLIDVESAAIHNGHTSTAITKKHYAFGEEARLREKLKALENEF